MKRNHTFNPAIFILCTFTTLFFLNSCGSDDSTDTVPDPIILTPTALDVKDINNQGNATDLEFSFNKPNDIDKVKEFRIFVVKNSQSASFDLSEAQNVTADNYTFFNKSSISQKITLVPTTKDTEGDLVQNDITYNLFVLAVATDESELEDFLSNPSTDITLEHKSFVRTLTSNLSAGSGGMDVDAEGNIYMGDFGSTLSAGGNKVLKITPEGNVSTFATGMNGASGNDFDANGNLFQSSTAGFISKITPERQVTSFVSNLSGGLIGVTVNDDGSMFVCNCGRNLIHEISAEGVESVYVTDPLLSCPNGIDKDAAGNLYIANFNNGNVIKITPQKNVSVFATIPGSNNGHLLIHNNFIYVVARGANSIYKVSMSGTASRFAGSGNRGLDNGSLNTATFSLPNDIAFSPDGTKMYVNDVAGSNSNVSVISPVVIRVIEIVD